MAIVKPAKPPLKPEEWGTCGHCGQHRLAASPREEGYAQCLGLDCGLRQAPPTTSGIESLFETAYREMHLELLKGDRVLPFLLGLGVHPSVVARAMVGEVPDDYDVAARFEPHVDEARGRVERIEAERPKSRPSKEYQAALAVAQYQLESLRQLDRECRECFDQTRGWLACFYESATHGITSVALINPTAPEQRIALQVGATMGTFNHGMFPSTASPREVLLGMGLFVVGDELELLLLQSLMGRRAREYDFSPATGTLFACATGLVTDANAVRALARQPTLCYHATPGGRELVETLRQEVNLFGFTPPGEHSTLTEFLRSEPNDARAFDLLQRSYEHRLLYTRPFANVREEIDEKRTLKKVEPFLKHRWAGERLLRDLQERGRLYWDGRLPYVFLHDTKEVIVGDEDNAAFPPLAANYGIAATDNGMFSHLLGALKLEAEAHGTETRVYSFAHYDPTRHVLYVFDLDRWVYRITPEKITTVENGTDGVLFVRTPTYEPFQIRTPKGNVGVLNEEILRGVQFEDGALSTDDQRLLILVWTLAMFFPELFPTKVILAMVGAKGSGKTSLLLRLGQLFFGPSFAVSDISTDAKDFDAAITNQAFVVVDNADKPIPWLEDKLAVAATGGSMKRRLYYTTNKLVDFPITAALAITSRTPHFRREDVADRLLLFHVQRYEDFVSQSYLLQEGHARRNDVLTEVFGLLQRAVAALKARATEHPRVKFRMADFAEFALKVTPAITGDDRMASILDRLAAAQLAFTAENEPLLDLLDDWLKTAGNAGRFVTTGELFEEMLMSTGYSPSFPFKNPQAFGQQLSSLDSTLRTLYQMKTGQVRSNRRQCAFWPRAEDAA